MTTYYCQFFGYDVEQKGLFHSQGRRRQGCGQGQGPPRFWQITPQIFKPSDIPAEMFGLSATPNGFEGYFSIKKYFHNILLLQNANCLEIQNTNLTLKYLNSMSIIVQACFKEKT